MIRALLFAALALCGCAGEPFTSDLFAGSLDAGELQTLAPPSRVSPPPLDGGRLHYSPDAGELQAVDAGPTATAVAVDAGALQADAGELQADAGERIDAAPSAPPLEAGACVAANCAACPALHVRTCTAGRCGCELQW